MKKFYLLLSLFIIPVFFFSIGEVRADTLTFYVRDSDIEYLSNEKFITIREQAISYCNENNKKYIIACDEYSCFAHIFNDGATSLSQLISGSFTYPLLSYSTVDVYKMSNGIFTYSKSSVSTSFKKFDTGSNEIKYTSYLDTNLDNLNFMNYASDITYGDFTYHIDSESHFVSLYEFYTLMNDVPDKPVVDDKFPEEKEAMNIFYSTIFTKIGDLATNFVTNYIFLLIFGIMILIFLIELIRRYLS